MKVFSATDIGYKRTENQDRVWISQLSGGAAAIVLCDGMGGELAGSYAAQITVDIVSGSILSDFNENISSNGIKTLLVTALNSANDNVFGESIRNIERRGMGTTCVAGIITPAKAYIINAGDSRAYHIYGDSMVQITRDHTYIRRLMENGMLTEDEAKRHPRRNAITRAIGAEEFITPDFFEEPIFPDSLFLFCSDGLHGYADDEKTAGIIGANAVEDICAELVKYSLLLGGSDNVTVALSVNEA